MKGVIAVFLLILLMTLNCFSISINEKVLIVKVDGSVINFLDAKPFINDDSRTLVPIRFIAESLGAEINWNENTQTVTITKDKVIVLKIGETVAKIDGIEKSIDTKAVLKENRCFLPLRFISESFSTKLYWNTNTYTVDIITATSPNMNKSCSGLLLGLSKKTDKEFSEYRTLWITQNKGVVTLTEQKDAILTPYNNSFLKVINKTYTKVNQSEGFIFSKLVANYVASYPVESKDTEMDTKTFNSKTDELFQLMDHGLDHTNASRILYIGNSIACFNNSLKHMDRQTIGFSSFSTNLRLIANNKSEKLIELLGNNTKVLIEDYGKNINKRLPRAESSNLNSKSYEEISKDDLFLLRDMGKWVIALPVIYRNIDYGMELSRWVKSSIILPEDIPQVLNQYNELCFDWNYIKEKIPNAVDAVSSPNNDMLVVQTDTSLQIFLNPIKAIDKPALIIPCASVESIVQNQWVTGEYDLNLWDGILQKYIN